MFRQSENYINKNRITLKLLPDIHKTLFFFRIKPFWYLKKIWISLFTCYNCFLSINWKKNHLSEVFDNSTKHMFKKTENALFTLFRQRNNAWRIELRYGIKVSGIASWSGGTTTPESLTTPVTQVCLEILTQITCERKAWTITYASTTMKSTGYIPYARCPFVLFDIKFVNWGNITSKYFFTKKILFYLVYLSDC